MDPTPNEVVETQTATIFLDGDILSIRVKPNTVITLDVAKADDHAGQHLIPDEPFRMMIDIREVAAIRREARAYYASQQANKHLVAIAMIVGSPLSRVIGNFFIGLNKPKRPVRLFTSEEEARSWLRSRSLGE